MRKASRKQNTVLSILCSQKGYSLSELLVTLVLVGLITAAVAGGISMIARSYTKVVDRADAEQLLSTAISRISDELSYAKGPVDYTETSVDFISGLTGMRVRLEAKSESIYMAYYYIDVNGNKVFNEIPLIDSKLKERMTLVFEKISYNKDGLFTINKLGVRIKDKTSVEIPSYMVAMINDKERK